MMVEEKSERQKKIEKNFSYLNEIFLLSNPEHFVNIRCIHPLAKKENPIKNFFLQIKELKEMGDVFSSMLEKLTSLNKKGYGIYFGVNPRIEEDSKKTYLQYTVSAHADFDLKEATGFKDQAAITCYLNQMSLKPSLIISSGQGVHAYWLFDSKTSVEDAEVINQGILEFCKNEGHVLDAGTYDATRILRLAPFKHTKYLDPRSNIQGELKTCVIEKHTDTRYSVDDLKKAFPYLLPNIKSTSVQSETKKSKKNLSPVQKKQVTPIQIENVVSFLSEVQLSESEWFRCGAALATACAEGRSLFHKLSSKDLRYSENETDKKFDSILKNNSGEIKAETLFFIAKGYGYPSTIREFLELKYDYHHDEIAKTIEIKEKAECEYKVIDDRIINTILIKAEDWGIFSSPSKITQNLNNNITLSINPVKDYLESLVWDGKDYIGELTKLLDTKCEHVNLYFSKWFIASVSNILDLNGRRSEICLILQGNQGDGKNQFFRNLLIETPLKKYFREEVINPSEKDDQIKICSSWIVLLDEFNGIIDMRSAENIKQMMTSQEYSIRKPYGREASLYRRIATFCGTVNSDQFLKDPTGNRRFLVVGCDNVDYETVINNAGLWAQAVYLFKKGERGWFTKEEIELINHENAGFESSFLEFDLVQQNYEKDFDRKSFFTTSEIFLQLQDLHKNVRLSTHRVGQALKKAGFKRESKRLGTGKQSRNGYYIKFKESNISSTTTTEELEFIEKLI